MVIRNGKLLKYILNKNEVINIINYEDKVEMMWTAGNMKYYIEKGYEYTKTREKFMVKIKDLPFSSHAKIPIKCDICGEDFCSSFNSLNRSLNKNFHVCKDCKLIKSAQIRVENQFENHWNKVEKMAVSKGYKLITTKETFPGTKGQIYYECPKHGIKHSEYGNFINGHGCYDCAREYTTNLQRNKPDKLIKYISSTNNNTLLNPEDYINSPTENLIILCGLCGQNTFTTSFTNYKNGVNRCEMCRKSMSRYELEIRNILDKYNIKYKPEKTFEYCRDKGLLPFDFYLYDYNTCIEFDGEQHYNMNYDITMKSPNPKLAFETRQKHDRMKTEYCNNNGIGLIRIPYWKKNHIEEIITEKLGIFK